MSRFGLCWLVLALAFTASPLAAKAQARSEGPFAAGTEAELLDTGRTHLWHLRLQHAEASFRTLAERPNGRATAYHHLATISYVKALITEEAYYYDEFFARSDSLFGILDEEPETAWNLFWKAESSLQRAMAWGRLEHMVRGAMAARTAYKLYEAAVDADPTLYDAYKGRGLFHILIGSMPSTHRRLLSIMGYSGTVEEGMRELQTAGSRGYLNREEALLYLALADLLLNNSKAGGMAQLASLRSGFPESPLFAYFYGFALAQNRQAHQAERWLRFAIEKGQTGDVFYLDYADFYLAEVLFQQRHYAEAETHFQRYLKRHRGRALKALAYLDLGLSLEMQGQREEALTWYRNVEQVRIYDSDVWAYRVAQQRLKAPMNPYERNLLEGVNAFEAGDYEVAIEVLRGLHRETTPLVHRTEAAYRLGRVYHAQGQLAKALEAYRFAIEHPSPEPMARWAPWSQFFAGEIYEEAGERAKAQAAFEAALAYQEPYDYHQSLEQQARTALGRVGPQLP